MADAGRETTPLACVCGHVKQHHGKQELAMLPYYPNCQWRGCGCPFYVTSEQATFDAESEASHA